MAGKQKAGQSKKGQTKARDTQARYHAAKAFIENWLSFTVPNSMVFPVWIEDSNSFWYERQLADGKEIRLVDASSADNRPAFDHEVLAKALAKATGESVDAASLPVNNRTNKANILLDMRLDPVRLKFTAFDKRWEFNDKTKALKEVEQQPVSWLISPAGDRVAFRRDHNIWLRDLRSGEERALTTDGEEFFAYGIPASVYGNDGFIDTLPLQGQWSPDGKRLFAVQKDQRQVEMLGQVDHVPPDGSLRPQTSARKLGFPGDAHVEEYRLVVIDVDSGRIQEPDYRRVPTTYGGTGGFFENKLGWWNTDSRHAYFIDVDRFYRYARVVEIDTDTGATRILFEECPETRVDLTMGAFDNLRLVPLAETNELLWFSDHTGWAHYYLYDLATGKCKNAVTSGQWLVRDFLHFDAKRREVFVTAGGRVEGREPYYREVLRVHVDTGEVTTLVSSDHEHNCISTQDIAQCLTGYMGTACGVSPRGDYAVVTRSRADQASETLLLDRDGKEVACVETGDVSVLPDGWQWPEPVKMTAADGKTDIYGLVYRPTDFSPDKTYPVLDHAWIGYQVPMVPKGSFLSGFPAGPMYCEAAALAELGFIVVQIDGRGSRHRDKAFRDTAHGWNNLQSNVDDHVAGIQQLAERYPYMDLGHVGIVGFSMGGNSALEGMLRRHDFFHVGVGGQLYDTRVMGANWGDHEEGVRPDPKQKFPEELVGNLKGKLLIMCGLQDYVPPAATFKVVEALQRANKDYDLIVEPNWGYGCSNYQQRRGWDFLVRHLRGEEPPAGFSLE